MVYPINSQNITKVFENESDEIQMVKDPFEIKMKTIELKPAMPHTELVTSKSLCTPGCGNTGTYNSYCC